MNPEQIEEIRASHRTSVRDGSADVRALLAEVDRLRAELTEIEARCAEDTGGRP